MRKTYYPLSILLVAALLQGCTGKSTTIFRLGAKEQPSRCGQVREVPWQGEAEERKQPMLPLLGGMPQGSADGDVKSRAEERQAGQEAQQAEGKSSGQQRMAMTTTAPTDAVSQQQASSGPVSVPESDLKSLAHQIKKGNENVQDTSQVIVEEVEEVQSQLRVMDADNKAGVAAVQRGLAGVQLQGEKTTEKLGQLQQTHQKVAALLQQLEAGQLKPIDFQQGLDRLGQSVTAQLQQQEARQEARQTERFHQFLKSLTPQLVAQQPDSGGQEAKQSAQRYRKAALKLARKHQDQALKHQAQGWERIKAGVQYEASGNYGSAASAYKSAINEYTEAKRFFEKAQDRISKEHDRSRISDEEYAPFAAMLKQRLAALPTAEALTWLEAYVTYLREGRSAQPPARPVHLLQSFPFPEQQATITFPNP